MGDHICTPAEALEAAARVAYFQMMKKPLCSAVSVADAIRALASRIPPAPDDEALARLIAKSLDRITWSSEYDDTGSLDRKMANGIKETREDTLEQAYCILATLREAGALR